jgi:hypothetical protein
MTNSLPPQNIVRNRDRFGQTTSQINKVFTNVVKVAKRAEPEQQIMLDIKIPRKNYWYNIKNKLNKLELSLEVLPYWKSGITVMTMVFALFISAMCFWLTLKNFAALPQMVPIFYNSTQNNWGLYDKSIFLFLPIIISAFNLILIRLNFTIYNFDRKFVYALCISQFLINVLVIIAFTQLLSFVLL